MFLTLAKTPLPLFWVETSRSWGIASRDSESTEETRRPTTLPASDASQVGPA